MRRTVSFGLGMLLLSSMAFVACGGGTEDRPSDDEGAGGMTGGASGTGTTGGTSGAATGGASGTATGGGPTGGTATGGGSGAGTTGGSGGSSGTNTCKACTPSACSTLAPPTDTINDFENLLVDPLTPTFGIYGANDDMGMPKPEWWLGYFSGTFAYPAVPDACTGEPTPMYTVNRTDVDGELHVSGTVGTYSGFGIWLGQCIVDMSGSTGVSFLIGGTAGSGMLKFGVNTNSNQAADTCLTGKGSCDAAVAGACTPASVTIELPATPTVVTVPWADLMGGSPSTSVDPAEVLQLQWDFEWADTMTPYEVDVTVDNVVLSHD